MATAQHDLLIRNARLRGQGDKLSDIAISNGRITAIGGGIAGSAVDTVNAEGNLVTESFVNTHLHLCKVWSLEKMDELAMGAYHGEGMGKAMSAIELARHVKRDLTLDGMIENARTLFPYTTLFRSRKSVV